MARPDSHKICRVLRVWRTPQMTPGEQCVSSDGTGDRLASRADQPALWASGHRGACCVNISRRYCRRRVRLARRHIGIGARGTTPRCDLALIATRARIAARSRSAPVVRSWPVISFPQADYGPAFRSRLRLPTSASREIPIVTTGRAGVVAASLPMLRLDRSRRLPARSVSTRPLSWVATHGGVDVAFRPTRRQRTDRRRGIARYRINLMPTHRPFRSWCSRACRRCSRTR